MLCTESLRTGMGCLMMLQKMMSPRRQIQVCDLCNGCCWPLEECWVVESEMPSRKDHAHHWHSLNP